MKNSMARRVLSVGIAVLFAFYSIAYPVTSLYALPQESEVVSGEVNFERVNNKTLNIHASDGSIINYDSFNIGKKETVQFYMPDVNAFSLNRVMGDGGTKIFGNLYANGNLILIDTHGIMFGSTANVQVGGLIASTIDISNQNFLNGAYIFGSLDQIPAEFSQVSNYGHIVTRDGGFGVLIGSSVVNEGTITAPLGTVALASGDMVTVGVSGDGFVSVGIGKEVSHQVFDAEGNPISDQIKNTGTLEAQGGRVLLNADAADAVFHQALNLEGVVKANHAEMQNGVVVITTSGSSQVNAEIETGSITFAAQSGKEARYDFNDSTLEIANHFINGENVTVNADNANIKVGGNWNNQGVFNGGNSSVEFVDASQSSTIYGDNDFYNFRSVVPDKYIYFEAGKTQTVFGNFHIQGSKGHLIHLRSTDPDGLQWLLDPKGSVSVSYVFLGDAWNVGPALIKALPSNSFGNNTNWDTDPVWDGGGTTDNWSDADNWDTGVVPISTDTVTFNGTSTDPSIVDALFAGTIAIFSISAGYTGTITLNRSLTVTGAFTQAAGTLDLGSQTFEVGGGWTHTAGGTFTANTGTVILSGAAATINVATTETFNHLTFAPTTLGATKTVSASDSLIVNGMLTLTEGNISQGTIPVAGTIQAKGDISQASTFDGGTGRIDINGTGTQTFTGSATTTTGNLPDININKASGTLNLAGTIRTNARGAGAWTYTAGTIAPGTSTVVWDGAMTVTGSHTLNNLTFNNAGARTISAGTTITTTGTFDYVDGSIATGTIEAQGDINQASTTDGGSGLLLINGTASQLFTGTATTAAGSLPDVTINKTGGTLTLSGTIRTSGAGAGAWTYTAGTVDATTNDSTVVFNGANTMTSAGMAFDNITFNGAGTKTLGSNLDVDGNLTISAGTFTTSASNFSINVAGNWDNAGTFTANSSTITFDGTSGTQTLNSGGSSFFNLVHSGASTLQLVTSNLTVTGALTNSAGTFDANGLGITVGGDWSNTATFTPGTGTVTFNAAAGTQTVNNGASSFNNISHTGAGTLQIVTNNLTVGGTLANSAGIFDMNGLTNTVTGLATISGGTYQGLTNTQTFNGGLTISGGTFTGSTGVVDVNGVVTLSSGTLTAPTGAFTVSGNWSRTGGTFTAGTGTVTFDGTTALTSGGISFNNVQLGTTIAGGSLTTNDAMDVNGTFTVLNGGATTFNISGDTISFSNNVDLTNLDTFTVTTSTVIFDGTTSLTSAGRAFNNVQLGTALVGGSLTTNDTTDINGTFTVLNGGATTFNISDDTVNFAGNVTLTNLDTFTNTDSTLVFDGTTALTSAGFGFNNVQLGTTIAGGSLTTNDAMDVNGTFTVLNGGATTFNISGDTISFSNNVDLTNLDTFTVTTSTVVFDGTTSLTSAGRAFNNVQLGTALVGGSLTTNDTTDINGTFTVLNGGATTFDIDSDTARFAGSVNLTDLDTFTVTGSTAVFDGTTALTSASKSFNNIQIGAAGSLTTSDALDVDGTFSIASGGGTSVFNISDDTVNFAGDVNLTNLDTFTTTNSTVIFDGTTALTSAAESFNNVQLGTASVGASLTTNDAMNVNGTFTVINGGATTFDISSDTVLFAADVNLTNLDTFTVTGSTVGFDGTTSLTSAGLSFNNVAVGSTIAGGSLTTMDNLDVNGTFTVNNGGATTWDISGDTINIAGTSTFSNLDTFTNAGSTVIFDGGTATITSIATQLFNVVTFDSTGTKTISGTLAVGGLLTLTNGIINAGTLNAQGDVTVGAGFDGGTTTLSFTGTAAQSFDLTGAEALYNGNVTVNKTAGTVTLLSDLTMDQAGQDLTVTLGELDLGGKNLTVQDQLTINGGTLTQNTGTITSNNDMVVSSGTLTRGAGLITVADDVTVSGSGIITASAGNMTLTGGAGSSFNVTGATASVSMGTGNLTAGDLNQSNGTFDGGTGTIDVNDDFNLTGGTFTATSGNMTVADNFTHSAGTFTHNGGTVTFDGSDGNQVISGSTTFNNLTRITATAQTLTFVAGTTQTIAGALILQGAAGGARLSLRSGTVGVQWMIDPQGTRTVSYLDMQDSNNINAVKINCFTGCVDAGNNTNWDFTPPVPPIPNISNNEVGLIADAMYPLWENEWPDNVEFKKPKKKQAVVEESFETRPDIYYDAKSMRKRREADAPMGFGAPKPGKKQEGIIICESLIFGGTACA